MRIATKLVLGSTAGMLVILAIHAVLSFQREMAIIDADRRQEGQRLAHAMALAVGLEWDHAGQEAAIALLREVASRDSDVQIRWNPASHHNATSSDRIDSAAIAVTPSNPVSQDVLHSYAPVRGFEGVESPSRGTIQITQVLADERARIRDSLGQLGFAVLLILLFNAILATVLSKRWVQRPVAKLLTVAEEVGRGNLGIRSTLTSKSGREFSELGSALDTMASRLQDAHRAREKEHAGRLEAEGQLQHAERLITIGKLASGVAHEVGTPLNVITGHADMIRRGQVDADGAVRSAETIGAHASRITSIIKHLLGFSRRHGPEKARTDLSKLCREATLSMLSSYAGKRGVTLDVDGLSEPHTAFVDPTQMQQVVSNLVMNGIQAMDSGGTLSVSLQRLSASPPPGVKLPSGDYLCLRVQDTGLGILPKDRKHIFEPFYTTKDIGEGTGLGLSIAYGIIRDHNGWIEVDSTPNKGTTFSVLIPKGEPDDEQDTNR